MIREFSEEKKEEIFRILDEIDMKEWKPFMEWCGSSAEEFGDWPDKLNVSAYTRYVDEYHQKILDLNEMTRQQVNTVFENVAEIDARHAKRMRECQEKIKEQIAMVRTMSEFMQSMTDGSPNMALLSGGNVSKAVDRTESTQKDGKEIELHHNGKEEQQPEVIVLDIPEAGVQVRSIIFEAEAQGIIGEPEVAFMGQLMHYIRESETISFGRLDGLEALYNNGLISVENYNCLSEIKRQTNGSGSGDYDVFDLKEQARNVYTEIEKVLAERTSIINEAEAQGIIGEPEVAFMGQLMHYIRESETISFGRLDGLEALYNNGLISVENYNCLSEIKKQTNGSGSGDYDVFDLKEQARNVYTEIEKVLAERTAQKVIVEGYVNEDVLRDVLKYNIDELDENFVEQLRTLMLEGGIVTDTSILFFLATIGVETGEEVMLLEDRDIDDFNGLTYTWNTRGAGPMQVTGGTQMEFIKYLIDHTDDVEERNRLQDYYDGFESKTITIKVNGEDKKIVVWDNTYKYNDMTVAEYIAEYYPYESAVWFWSYNRASFEIDGQYLSINECIEQYNGVVDDDTMFLAVTCAVNGSEFGTRGKGRFLYPYNDVTIVGGKIVLIFVDTEDDMVGTPAYYNSYQYTNGDGYRVYKQTSYIPNGWDRRSTLYDNLKDYFKED